ncbi:hypothetical protein [Enterococcus alishanensis]
MKKSKYLNNNLTDLKTENLPLNIQEGLLKLGIMVILFRGSLIVIAILIIALILWFNKLTIFFAAVQFIFCFVLFKIRQAVCKKVKKQISQE